MILPLPPEDLDDKTLDKQIEAIAQTLCNVHFKLLDAVNKKYMNGGKLTSRELDTRHTANSIFSLFTIKPKDLDDEYSKWATEYRANYLKLVDMGLACCEEWSYRFERICKIVGNDYPFDIEEATAKPLHEHQEVIIWARDNMPDLPNIIEPEHYAKEMKELQASGSLDYCSIGYQYKCTQFPLVMPKKYLPKFIPVKYVQDEDKTEYIEYCYRNYYKAQLQKMGRKKCEECEGTGKSLIDEFPCCPCDANGYIMQTPTFTRRQKPEWLADL